MPVSAALLQLKGKLLAVLRLLLLEGRVLFYAKSAASVSETGEEISKNMCCTTVSLCFPAFCFRFLKGKGNGKCVLFFAAESTARASETDHEISKIMCHLMYFVSVSSAFVEGKGKGKGKGKGVLFSPPRAWLASL